MALEDLAQGFGGSIPFLKVGSVKTKENQAYEGRYLAEIAQEEEKEISFRKDLDG